MRRQGESSVFRSPAGRLLAAGALVVASLAHAAAAEGGEPGPSEAVVEVGRTWRLPFDAFGEGVRLRTAAAPGALRVEDQALVWNPPPTAVGSVGLGLVVEGPSGTRGHRMVLRVRTPQLRLPFVAERWVVDDAGGRACLWSARTRHPERFTRIAVADLDQCLLLGQGRLDGHVVDAVLLGGRVWIARDRSPMLTAFDPAGWSPELEIECRATVRELIPLDDRRLLALARDGGTEVVDVEEGVLVDHPLALPAGPAARPSLPSHGLRDRDLPGGGRYLLGAIYDDDLRFRHLVDAPSVPAPSGSAPSTIRVWNLPAAEIALDTDAYRRRFGLLADVGATLADGRPVMVTARFPSHLPDRPLILRYVALEDGSTLADRQLDNRATGEGNPVDPRRIPRPLVRGDSALVFCGDRVYRSELPASRLDAAPPPLTLRTDPAMPATVGLEGSTEFGHVRIGGRSPFRFSMVRGPGGVSIDPVQGAVRIDGPRLRRWCRTRLGSILKARDHHALRWAAYLNDPDHPGRRFVDRICAPEAGGIPLALPMTVAVEDSRGRTARCDYRLLAILPDRDREELGIGEADEYLAEYAGEVETGGSDETPEGPSREAPLADVPRAAATDTPPASAAADGASAAGEGSAAPPEGPGPTVPRGEDLDDLLRRIAELEARVVELEEKLEELEER